MIWSWYKWFFNGGRRGGDGVTITHRGKRSSRRLCLQGETGCECTVMVGLFNWHRLPVVENRSFIEYTVKEAEGWKVWLWCWRTLGWVHWKRQRGNVLEAWINHPTYRFWSNLASFKLKPGTTMNAETQLPTDMLLSCPWLLLSELQLRSSGSASHIFNLCFWNTRKKQSPPKH